MKRTRLTRSLVQSVAVVATVGFYIALSTSLLLAQPVRWAGNGHYYERIDTGQIDWLEAKALAEARVFLGAPGYLATVTTQEELNFILANLGGANAVKAKWLGGYENPEGAWHWLTGEPWAYTNWCPTEPNDFYHTLDGLQFCPHAYHSGGEWNDHPQSFRVGDESGYIVEYEPVGTKVRHVTCTKLRQGNRDIWRVDLWPDGTRTEQRLTTDAADDDFAVPSHDGTKIAWLRTGTLVNGQIEHLDLWVMNADGSGQRQLARLPDSARFGYLCLAWSPDDEKIVTGYETNLVVTRVADGQVLAGPVSPAFANPHGLHWSPDGTTILVMMSYSGWPRVARINADLTGYVVLDNRVRTMGPTYNRQGTKIVYDLSAWGFAEIWLMEPDGSNKTSLLADTFSSSTHVKQHFAWAPDGTRILYARYVTEGATNTSPPLNAYLAFINPDGSNNQILPMPGCNLLYGCSSLLLPQAVNNSEIQGRNQCWSVDGQIVFMSHRDGNWEIYMMNADGSGQANLTQTPHDAEWNPQFLETQNVGVAPYIVVQPVNRTVSMGSQVIFRVAAIGNPAPAYQWKFNGVDIPGATGPVYVIPSAQVSDAGFYLVVVSNAFGRLDSVTVSLAFLDIDLIARLVVRGPVGIQCRIEYSTALNSTSF